MASGYLAGRGVFFFLLEAVPRTSDSTFCLQAEEYAIIEDVRFELHPVRLCCLKLKQINPTTNRPTGIAYTVRYVETDYLI